MTRSIDLNADLGESFGPWVMGMDEDLLDIVSSANVACGFHAGDWDVMARTMRAAARRNVGVGAHPGFADLQGFGRRRIDMPLESLGNLVRYQIGAAQAMARAAGTQVRHLKLHGALANMASEDETLARACYEAALSVAPDIIVVVMTRTAQDAAARALGCRTAQEIYADRGYNEDGTLVDRRKPGAVIKDPAEVTARVLRMVEAGAIIAENGVSIPTQIDTICLHGDTPSAIELARALRAGLEADGLTVAPFGSGTA